MLYHVQYYNTDTNRDSSEPIIVKSGTKPNTGANPGTGRGIAGFSNLERKITVCVSLWRRISTCAVRKIQNTNQKVGGGVETPGLFMNPTSLQQPASANGSDHSNPSSETNQPERPTAEHWKGISNGMTSNSMDISFWPNFRQQRRSHVSFFLQLDFVLAGCQNPNYPSPMKLVLKFRLFWLNSYHMHPRCRVRRRATEATANPMLSLSSSVFVCHFI